jgi:hypothetical protein
MKLLSTSLVLIFGSTFFLTALSASAVSREEALRKLDACVHSKSGRKCNHIQSAEETLARLYRQGDKSLLPALMETTWMGDLYADAALNDTASYLSALSTLDEPKRRAVEASMAGGLKGWQHERFLSLQEALLQVPAGSPEYPLAQDSLRQLNVANASFLAAYFPPQIFNRRGGDFQTRWYSRALYALDQAPLWPPAANRHLYRFTFLPAFSDPVSITLTVLPAGDGEIRLCVSDHVRVTKNQTRSLSAQQVKDVLALMDQADFWQMPVESDRRGLDGAEWIMEGVHDGQYHLVTRWSPERSPYQELGQAFIKFSGYSK